MTARMTSRWLVGREAELASLRVLLTAAAAGEARVAVVSGDAEIGKTRLLEALAAEARAAGFVTATGGAVRLGAVSVPFAPLVEALRALQDGLGDPRIADVLTMLGDGAPGSGSVLERVLSLLTALELPVLLTFEDLHWTDAATRDLMAFLGRNLRAARVALVLSCRDGSTYRIALKPQPSHTPRASWHPTPGRTREGRTTWAASPEVMVWLVALTFAIAGDHAVARSGLLVRLGGLGGREVDRRAREGSAMARRATPYGSALEKEQ